MITPHPRATTLAVANRLRTSENGIGLIEIVISMMLLALLATALVPVLVSGLKQASSSATLATATQLANDELERVRGWKRCGQVLAFSQTVTDARSVQLTVTTTVGSCSSSAGTETPVSIPVTVAVKRLDTSVVVTSTTTYIFIADSSTSP